MPRLFTGLEIPQSLAHQLSMLSGGMPGARWIDRENYHVTLRFIGDIDNAMAREVVSALDEVRHGPLTLKLDGLGSFGGNKPHNVFAKIAPNRELADLQSAQERLMQRLGLKPEKRSFSPHITLARCGGLPPGAVAHWLTLRGTVMDLSFDVERFVLYSARDSRGGGPYVLEEEYPLIA